jgi:mono/diheme cytochrome c family protein
MRRRASWVAGAIALVGAFIMAELTRAEPAAQQPGGRTRSGAGRITGGDQLARDRWQPKRLPALPTGMTLAMIRAGDSLYRGKGGCVMCHGPDGFGGPDSGSAVTLGLNFIPVTWPAIDSLITAGIPESLTRTTIAMPPRGLGQNLTPEEVRTVAAYTWAIATTADEPWPGGHRTHTAVATGTGDTASAARPTP